MIAPQISTANRLTALVPNFLRNSIRVTALIFSAVIVVTLAIGLTLPRHYVATADLWLDRGRADPGLRQPDRDSMRLARNTELRLLDSRDLAARTVSALGLDRVRGLGQPHDGVIRDTQIAQRAAISAVKTNLTIEPLDDSYAVRLRFRADKPEVAASIVNRIADLYVEDRRGTSTRARRIQRLNAIVDQSRDAMVRSEAARDAYRSATAFLTGTRRPADAQRDIAAIDAELDAMKASAAAGRAREARAIANAAPRLRDLERLRAQRAVEDNQGSEAIDKQIADQRRYLDRVGLSARVAEARIALLTRTRERTVGMESEGHRIESELAVLASAADEARNRNVRAKAALVREFTAETRRRSTAYVISRSAAQNAYREPRTWLIALCAFLAAAAVAGLTAFILERRQKGFTTADALERALGIEVLALIPTLSERRAIPVNNRLSVPDHLVEESDSPLAKAFGQLLSGIRAQRRNERLIIAVSSALPEEGKTTVSLCLARAAAMHGLPTVLIDCDLRRPAASRALFPSLTTGLVEVIGEKADLAAALQRDPGSQAMVLGISSQRQERVVTLDPKAMVSLLARLQDEFQIIICDTPPALALSEAREMAALADGVVLVVRHRETPRGAVIIAQDLLVRAGAKLDGAVLTMVRT